MRNIPEAFVIAEPVTWQFRRAQSVDKNLSQAIHQICERNEKVRSCFLFDTRQKEGAETKLVIALLLDDEAIFLRQIAAKLQDKLSDFPDIASKTAIMSATSFKEQFAGAEFYVRAQTTH